MVQATQSILVEEPMEKKSSPLPLQKETGINVKRQNTETSIKLEGGLGQRVELGQGQAESPGRVEGAGQGHMSTITQDPSTEMA